METGIVNINLIVVARSSSLDMSTYSNDDFQTTHAIAGVMMKLLTEKRSILVQQMLEFIEESDTDSTQSRERRQKRFLKTSTFWEEDCQAMTEDKFVEFYRLTKSVFGEVLEIIYPHILTNSAVGDSIDPPKKLAITLRYMATGDSFVTLAHLFRVGASTVRSIIHDVTHAITNLPFFKSLVSFPVTEDDFYNLSKDFFDRFQFPDTVGAVDDTHVKIMKPRTDPSSYFDYKKDYSIHLQAVCDARTRVLFYHIGSLGENNDGGVAEMSGFNAILRSERIPKKYHILGDPAFALHPNLLNRYPGLHLFPFEKLYNYRQSRARMVVESLFGRLKGRWHVLIKPMPFRNLDLVNNIVLTTVLLHNFLITKDDARLHPQHHFQDNEYKELMAALDAAKEIALEEANKSRKKKMTELTAKEKRGVIADVLSKDLSEENCVLFLGM